MIVYVVTETIDVYSGGDEVKGVFESEARAVNEVERIISTSELAPDFIDIHETRTVPDNDRDSPIMREVAQWRSVGGRMERKP